MGLLAKMLLGGGLGAGAGAFTANDPNEMLMRALLGAGAGGAIGAGVGMLGRKAARALPMATKEDYLKAVIEARNAMGQTGSKATQFPPGAFTKAIDKATEAKLGSQFPEFAEYAPESQPSMWQKMSEGISGAWGDAENAAGRLNQNVHDVWDAVDRVGNRAFKNWKYPAYAAAGTAGVIKGVDMLRDIQNGGSRDELMRDDAMKELGMPPGELSLRAFQAKVGLQPTGQMTDETKAALGQALAEKGQH